MSEEKSKYEYEINGSLYTQEKMKLGQVKQLNKLIGGISIPTNFSAVTMFTVFGSILPQFMSIVLKKKGTKLEDKDVEALEKEFDAYADVEDGFRVIQDFFDCNPIASYFETMTEAIQKVSQAANPQLTNTSKN